jgi:hypothetical protein
MVLRTLADLYIADILKDGPMTAEEIAARVGMSYQCLVSCIPSLSGYEAALIGLCILGQSESWPMQAKELLQNAFYACCIFLQLMVYSRWREAAGAN